MEYATSREVEPDNIANLVSLGEALLAEGRGNEALPVAEEALRLEPVHPGAQALLKNASVSSTMSAGKWEADGKHREKLRDEEKAIALEQAAKLAKKSEPPASL